MWPFGKREQRAQVVQVDSGLTLEQMIGGWDGFGQIAGVPVTIDTALGVPSVWAAVNFLSGTMAGLPLNVFNRDGEARSRDDGPMQALLHDAVSDAMTSFDWRQQLFSHILTFGRGYTFINRSPSGKVLSLDILDPQKVTPKRVAGVVTYTYRENGTTQVYQAKDIIDIPFLKKADGLAHYSPILSNKMAIGLAIASTQYGSKFFENGGVPPFAVIGDFQSAAALGRAGDDLRDAVRKAAKENRQALTMPKGLDIKPIGADAQKSQLIETQRFCIEQVARIYSLPPTFLQDLTHGTMSNTEQQDLHFMKHTLNRWVQQFEQELNLKIWGRDRSQFCELNVDGLLRGDFATRMAGYATAIQNAIMAPNEARRKENLEDNPAGDSLLVQGATVPLANQIIAPLGATNNDNQP